MVMGAPGWPDRVVVNLPPVIAPESVIVSPGCAFDRADVNWLAVETRNSWGARASLYKPGTTLVETYRPSPLAGAERVVLVAGLFKVTVVFCATAPFFSTPVTDTVDVADIGPRAMSDVRANSAKKITGRERIRTSLDLGCEGYVGSLLNQWL